MAGRVQVARHLTGAIQLRHGIRHSLSITRILILALRILSGVYASLRNGLPHPTRRAVMSRKDVSSSVGIELDFRAPMKHKALLKTAVRMAFGDTELTGAQVRAVGWASDESKEGLWLHSFEMSSCTDFSPFICELGPDACAEMALDWLTQRWRGGLHGSSDIDGSCEKGWKVSSRQRHFSDGFCLIAPCWIVYPK